MHRLHIVVWGVALAVLGAGGCSQPDVSPSPGLSDPVPSPYNDPTIVVLPEMRDLLGFHEASIVVEPDQPLDVTRPVRNLTNQRLELQYRFLFLDRHGRVLEPTMGWARANMERKQLQRWNARALSTDATTYRLEVRWAP